MALIRMDHVPETVKVNIPLYIILPDPGRMNDKPIRERKVLYLLHGLSDDASAWQRYSSIETIVRPYDLVVVMPTVGRSFYIDQPNGQKYFTYLMKELPQYLSDVFGLSPKREDTLIAGISMGGYGAFKAAFLHPERFHAAASLSGVLSLQILNANPNDPRHEEFAYLFGDLSKLAGSQHDPAVWLQNAVAEKVDLPRLFMYCGLQEDLLPLNRLFHAACQTAGVNPAYHEEGGNHDWVLWDRQIQSFLKDVLG